MNRRTKAKFTVTEREFFHRQARKRGNVVMEKDPFHGFTQSGRLPSVEDNTEDFQITNEASLRFDTKSLSIFYANAAEEGYQIINYVPEKSAPYTYGWKVATTSPTLEDCTSHWRVIPDTSKNVKPIVFSTNSIKEIVALIGLAEAYLRDPETIIYFEGELVQYVEHCHVENALKQLKAILPY
jgi:hypothetical protein